jgi:hypothetical protein
VLSLFGLPVPDYMDGKALTVGGFAEGARGEREEDLAEAAR